MENGCYAAFDAIEEEEEERIRKQRYIDYAAGRGIYRKKSSIGNRLPAISRLNGVEELDVRKNSILWRF